MTREEYEAQAKSLYNELCNTIERYVKFTNATTNPESSIYVNGWTMVMNIGVLEPTGESTMALSYEIESFPPATPPHAVKGMLEQGIDEVKMLQYSTIVEIDRGDEEDWDM